MFLKSLRFTCHNVKQWKHALTHPGQVLVLTARLMRRRSPMQRPTESSIVAAASHELLESLERRVLLSASIAMLDQSITFADATQES
jgi:hypothetical protein